MATNLTVDSADNSSRWYITPGKTSAYDLQVHNDTDRAVLCRVTLASHPDTGSVKPSSLTLQARETRIVSVTFGPTAELPRDRKAVVLVKDAAGQVLRTIERDLVSGASTDATVDLSWKAPIVEDGKLCGFVLLCNIRSLSGSADEFTPEFAPHAALVFPQLSQVWLEPGDTARLELPIRWNRSSRDAEGWNHPRAIEAFVAVSQGRRSGRLSWDVVQRTISDMLDRSDRSPVVERKAAAPSFASAGAAAPAKAAPPPPPLAAVPDKPVAVVPEKPVASVPEKVVAADPDKPVVAAVPEKLVAVPDKPVASVDKRAASNDKPVSAPDKSAAIADQPVVAPSKLAAVPDKPVAEPAKPMAMPAKGAAAIDKRFTVRTKETGTALVVVLKALGPAKIPAATSSPAPVAPAAAAATAVAASAIAAPVIAAATQTAPAAAPVVAPAAAAAVASPVVTPVVTPGAFVATTTVISAAAAAAVAPAAVAATATIPDDIAQRRPSAQPQPQPKPVITDAPKPQAPEAPKRVSDISAELANKFDGYRPAFQLVNNQAASQTSATAGGGTAPHDSTLRVDDLDASIVGSGLNYARSATNGQVVGAPVRRSIPAGAWVAGIAVAAVLGFALFRPHSAPTTTATNTAAAPVAVPAQHHTVAVPARAAHATHVVAHVATKPKVAPPSPAAVAQTPAPTTAPVAHANVAPPPVATVAHTAPARQVVRRPPPVDRGALPNIDYVNAAYGRYGRAVRVDWSSTAQASADVQLTDARGTLIGERTVGPSRSFVVVGLPRGYHGGIFVQVSVTGYHSERVVQTSSLSPF
jgi:hypothetical protein